MNHGRTLRCLLFTIAACAATAPCADWPQFQHDAARTGRTTDSLSPPYRMRWFWQGAAHVVRNRLSNPSWSGPDFYQHDIITVKVPTVPRTVGFTFSALMQPIVAGTVLYAPDQEGTLYAINISDGSMAWIADNPGGSMASAAYASGIVVTGTLRGEVRAFNAASGTPLWSARTGGPITHAPAIVANRVLVGSHDRRVYCYDLATGARQWVSPDLGGQIAGGIAADSSAVYAVTETMRACRIGLNGGALLASLKIGGKSCYLQHPVVFAGKVYVETAPVPAVGSEDIAGDLIAAATSLDDEQNRWLDFMQGRGGYAHASPDWKHLFVLNTDDMREAFQVPNGLYEGCGTPPESPVVDNQNRVITYWRSKWNYFARDCGWGCPNGTQIDLSAIDQTTGRRIVIDNGAKCDEWFTWESDNLYAMSVCGNWIYLHQDYRGTVCINLRTSRGHRIWSNSVETATSYNNCDAVYTTGYDDNPPNPPPVYPSTPGNSFDGRAAPVIAGGYLFVRQPWAIICMEKAP